MTQNDSLASAEEVAYEPCEGEIEEYGKWLGMDLPEDKEFLWIAQQGLEAPLPKFWKACKSEKGDLYYFNLKTGESIWDHPLDEHFKELFRKEKEKAHLARSSTTPSDENVNRVRVPPSAAASANEDSGSASAIAEETSKFYVEKTTVVDTDDDDKTDTPAAKRNSMAKTAAAKVTTAASSTGSSASSSLASVPPRIPSNLSLALPQASLRDKGARAAPSLDMVSPSLSSRKSSYSDVASLRSSPMLTKTPCMSAAAGGGINALKALSRQGVAGGCPQVDMNLSLASLSDEPGGSRASTAERARGAACEAAGAGQPQKGKRKSGRLQDDLARTGSAPAQPGGLSASLLEEKYRRKRIILVESYRRELDRFELACRLEVTNEKARLRSDLQAAAQRYREQQEHEWTQFVSSVHSDLYARQAEARLSFTRSFEQSVQSCMREHKAWALELTRLATDELSRTIQEHRHSCAHAVAKLDDVAGKTEASADDFVRKLRAAQHLFIDEVGRAQARRHASSSSWLSSSSAPKVPSPEPIEECAPAQHSSLFSSGPSSVMQSSPRSASSSRRCRRGSSTSSKEQCRRDGYNVNELRSALERDVERMRAEMQKEMREELKQAVRQLQIVPPDGLPEWPVSPFADKGASRQVSSSAKPSSPSMPSASGRSVFCRQLAAPPLSDHLLSLSEHSCDNLARLNDEKVTVRQGSLRNLITDAVLDALREVTPSKVAVAAAALTTCSQSCSFSKDCMTTPRARSTRMLSSSTQSGFHCLSPPFASTKRGSLSCNLTDTDRRTSSAPSHLALSGAHVDHVNHACDAPEVMSVSAGSVLTPSRPKGALMADMGKNVACHATADRTGVVSDEHHEWGRLLRFAKRKSDQFSLRRHELHLAKRRWKAEMCAAKRDGVRSVSVRGQELRAEHARLQRELEALAQDQLAVNQIELWLSGKLHQAKSGTARMVKTRNPCTSLSKADKSSPVISQRNKNDVTSRRASLQYGCLIASGS